MLERWTRAVLRARAAVLVCWLALLLVGIYASAQLPGHLSNSFAVPGTDSARAQTLLTRGFGERTDGTFTVVFPVAHPSDKALSGRLRRRLALAAAAVPDRARETAPQGGGDPLRRRHHGSTSSTRSATRTPSGARCARGPAPRHRPAGDPARPRPDPRVGPAPGRGDRAADRAARPHRGVRALARGRDPVPLRRLHDHGHPRRGLRRRPLFPVVTYVTNLVELIGLGLAIDYSLLVVYRFREELERAATRPTRRSCGRWRPRGAPSSSPGSRSRSGSALLLFMPVPFIRSMGVGGVLDPARLDRGRAHAPAALLSLLGPASGRRLARRRAAATSTAALGAPARARSCAARSPTSRSATAVLLALAAPALFLRLTPGSISGIPSSPESVRGYALLRDRVGAGVVMPTEVVVDAAPGPRPRARSSRLADALFHDPEVLIVASGTRRPTSTRAAATRGCSSPGATSTAPGDAAPRPPAPRRRSSPRRASPPECTSTRAARRRRGSTSSGARTARSRGSCSPCSS